MPEFLTQLSPIQIVGIIFVAIFIAKKLLKWAIIVGILLVVAVPYLTESGTFEQVRDQLGV